MVVTAEQHTNSADVSSSQSSNERLSNDDDTVSSLSSDGEEEVVRPRSIFESYWKRSPGSKPSSIVRPSSPKCVRSAMDPYSHFGLVEEEKEEDASINTYERILKRCEVIVESPRNAFEGRPLWTQLFINSAPTLHSSPRWGSPYAKRSPKSDSMLHVRPLKSVLRKGRFSGKACVKQERHVNFQPVITVHPFEPPVESWAAKGWSSWFGL